VALPESGATLWTDNMLVPALAQHKKNAELAMNYYYDPVVAATVAAYVQYITPVKGAKEAMAEIDPSLVDNQWIFPSEETLANSYVFMTLTPEQNEKYEREFQTAIGN
jgi:spermidine/putrescine transport system substrate-binding protein